LKLVKIPKGWALSPFDRMPAPLPPPPFPPPPPA
jgi:hypothetical protein